MEDVKGEKKGEKGGGRISKGKRPKEHSLPLLDGFSVWKIYIWVRGLETPCCGLSFPAVTLIDTIFRIFFFFLNFLSCCFIVT